MEFVPDPVLEPGSAAVSQPSTLGPALKPVRDVKSTYVPKSTSNMLGWSESIESVDRRMDRSRVNRLLSPYPA